MPIHSVRLPGLVADQEVILGDVAQTLTHPPRHDRPHELHARRAAGRARASRSCPTGSPSGSSGCSGRTLSVAFVAVTDHAAERYRQRVRGTLDAAAEIAARVGRAWAAGDVSREPPPGAAAQRGSVYVRDGDIVYVCLEDRPRGELVVVTLWEEGRTPPSRVGSPTSSSATIVDGCFPDT